MWKSDAFTLPSISSSDLLRNCSLILSLRFSAVIRYVTCIIGKRGGALFEYEKESEICRGVHDIDNKIPNHLEKAPSLFCSTHNPGDPKRQKNS